MITVGKRTYSVEELLTELRRLADSDSGVVWHDTYVPALTELDRLGRTEPALTTFDDINGVLVRIGGMLVGAAGYQLVYEWYVNEGARLILDGKPAFERSDTPKRYNAAFWSVSGAGDDAVLRLKPGAGAFDAVVDVAGHSGAFTLDCAAYVQAVELYARARARGATAYNAETSGRDFVWKDHGSTGLTHAKLFFRRDSQAEWRLRTPATDARKGDEPTVKVTDRRLLDIAPIGSRVAFANADPLAEGTDYERENTVKLARDLYASQPFGVLDAATVRRRLAQQTILRYLAEIERNLERVIGGEDARIAVEQARTALQEIGTLADGGDPDAQAEWILGHKDLADNLLYDDLDEYVADLVYLAEVEIYTITPENDETRKFQI